MSMSYMQVWHGTVSQIEAHYGVNHFGVEANGVMSQHQFMKVVKPMLMEHNQVGFYFLILVISYLFHC